MKFNERFKEIREDKDLNQTQMGKILNMSQRKISRLENNDTNPTPEEIVLICKTFKISADYLLGITNKRP
ncbi:MAG: helix-turn-helix transcriptional regulator [Clostridia bacterium]|nr:helix-turn-helix transcriptional regulator [Clostridia bacterium]